MRTRSFVHEMSGHSTNYIEHTRFSILAPLGILFLFFPGCRESAVESKFSPQVTAEINRIQLDHKLSDQEISKALERWIEVYAGTRDLLESEDVYGNASWTPERFADLMNETERALKEARQEDRMLTIISLGHLSALNEKRYDQIGDSMREIVVKHYASVEGRPNEADKNFIQKVKKLAEIDSELQRRLDGKNTVEHNPAGQPASAPQTQTDDQEKPQTESEGHSR